MSYTTLTQKWQMTLPKDIRELLGISQPGKIFISADKKTKTLKIEKIENIFNLAGKLKPKRKPIDPVKIRELMEKNYVRF